MKFDYSKLLGRIVEKFGTQRSFSKKIGISQRALSEKLNNKSVWKQSEIDKSVELLSISPADIGLYFFNKKVQ